MQLHYMLDFFRICCICSLSTVLGIELPISLWKKMPPRLKVIEFDIAKKYEEFSDTLQFFTSLQKDRSSSGFVQVSKIIEKI